MIEYQVDGNIRKTPAGVPISSYKPFFDVPTTLVAADNGAVCEFNTAAGQLYTLPAAQVGLSFRFIVRTTATSGVHRVACTTGDFFLGALAQATDGTYVTATNVANGTSHLAWEGNGSTTSGIVGDWFDILAISTTKWLVTAGYTTATGTEATFWKTS